MSVCVCVCVCVCMRGQRHISSMVDNNDVLYLLSILILVRLCLNVLCLYRYFIKFYLI